MRERFREKFALQDTEMEALPEGKLSMVEWAKENFRLDSPGLFSTLRKKTVKGQSADDVTTKMAMELVKWTPRPIKVPLNRTRI